MISVIIPVYNVGDYIKECLESILMQTYKDLQIIIVDDGSSDNTMNIVNEYEDKFENYTILHQKNAGVSVARNTAFNHIEGEYTMYIDPDDFLECDMLEKMQKEAEAKQVDIVISEYYVYYNKNDSRNYIESYDIDARKIYNNYYVIDMMLNYELQGQLWNKLFRTQLLKEIEFKFEPGRYIQDAFPVFKAIYNSKGISFIDKPLYYYRQRETSTVHKKNAKLAEDYYFAMSSIIHFIKDKNIKVNQQSLKIFRIKVLSHFIAHYTNADESNSLKTFRNSKYNELSVKNREFLFLSEICKEDKIKLFLWNSNLYPILKKIKNR
ncbi:MULTISPECIES: glycosyltransferase [unclassified Clostridium]|uniref:glycosyltransferase family 2 protein n=1 Tax=unclassified Clostridium TaxID=2614128 RepID=UPI00029854E3|nr:MULTISPECIES: glycosyltransferase [unclassified Clostridium]EKQ56661.1 MAG: glycosyl transferase [Clostridium sp. Maddingley MBC34-26]